MSIGSANNSHNDDVYRSKLKYLYTFYDTFVRKTVLMLVIVISNEVMKNECRVDFVQLHRITGQFLIHNVQKIKGKDVHRQFQQKATQHKWPSCEPNGCHKMTTNPTTFHSFTCIVKSSSLTILQPLLLQNRIYRLV